MQDENGQINLAHSISAGLDYPGVGPELSYLKDQDRIQTYSVTDGQAIKGCKLVAEYEGIIPALETSHAFALLIEENPFKKGDVLVFCLSGRGDKDMETLSSYV